MKIAFITEGNPEDFNQWSGTVCQMYSMLKKKYEIVEIDILQHSKIIDIFCRLLEIGAKLTGKRYNRTYSVLRAKKASTCVTKALRKVGDIDLIFCPAKSGSIAFVNTNIPIIYLTDATFGQMINYYEYLSKLSFISIAEGNKIESYALKKATYIIAASNWAKESMVKDYNVSKEKITVVPFGANLSVDIEKTKKDKSFHILFCGVDWKRKGGQMAVDTVKELNNRGFSVVLDFIGCNPQCEISEDYISLHGFLSKNNKNELKKLEEIYSNADVLLLPTKAECAGIVFAEASGYGIPSVTFDTGGIESYVYNEITGFRLPINSNASDFADKIESLITDEELFSKMKQEAYSLYKEKLNWNSWLDNFDNIINTIEG